MQRVVAAAVLCLAFAAASTAAIPVGSRSADLIVGTPTTDRISAGAGADRISVWGDGRRDRVNCGTGLDLVNAELNDVLETGCETVAHQISRDRTTIAGPQRGTQAEPDSHSVGDTLVTVFQTGRYLDGGAAGVGFATSSDGGVTWREGALPKPSGYLRQTDPVVAYDAVRHSWLAGTLGLTGKGGTALLVSRSPDGVTWSEPVVAAAESDPDGGLDKEWIVCDNGEVSTFRGRCYLAATELTISSIQVQMSVDGGLTWSSPVRPARTVPQGALGAFPVVRPNGDLVVLYLDLGEGPAALFSRDGGAHLVPVDRFFGGEAADIEGVRSTQLIAADVGPTGRVYAVWAECGLRRRCTGNDVVLAESEGGDSWLPRRRVPTLSTGSAFIPTVAVDPASGRIGVLYYSAAACTKRCRIDAWLIESRDGIAWTRPIRLSTRSMELPWIARSNEGAMLGDYISLSYVRGHPRAVLALAEEPRNERLRQATFVVTKVAPALRIAR